MEHYYQYEPIPMGRSNSDSSATTYATDFSSWPQSGFGSYDDSGTDPSAEYYDPAEQAYSTTDPLTLFTQTIRHIDSKAFEISSNALAYLETANGDELRQMYKAGEDLPSLLITSKAITRKVGKSSKWNDEHEREAALNILVELLFTAFTTDNPELLASIDTMLYEAATHILLRVEGCPNQEQLCCVSICCALKSVEEKLLRSCLGEKEQVADTSRRSSRSSRSSSNKGKWICDDPTCQSNSFSRFADLARHKSSVHLDETNREQFFCDYKKCPRSQQPFHRQDHFRDHLRDQHKEDLLRRGSKSDEDWWASRNKRALFGGWWRCSKCMNRATDGEWVCDRCGHGCENERRNRRAAYPRR